MCVYVWNMGEDGEERMRTSGWKLSAYIYIQWEARMPIVAAGNLVRGQRRELHFSAAK